MWFSSWLRNRKRHGSPRKRTTRRPTLEALEDRWALSTLTVLNNLDSGPGSLRADIAAAKTGDTIVFAPSLGGQQILLTSGQLEINKNLTIKGLPNAPEISGGGFYSRVFEVDANTNVTLTNLAIIDGDGAAYSLSFDGQLYDGWGGGVLNLGTLTVSSCTLSGNSGEAGSVARAGGGIFNDGDFGGKLTVSGCTLSGNSADSGGGIFNYYGAGMVSNSTLSGNSAYDGGGISNDGGTLTISGCSLSGNSANSGGGIYNSLGTLTVSGCTLSGNSATNEGGGIANAYKGTATVTRCTLSGNTAAVEGGGIYNAGKKLTVSDSIFSDNSPDNIFGPYTNKGGNTFR